MDESVDKNQPNDEVVRRLHEIAEQASEIAFTAQKLIVDSRSSEVDIGANDLTTLLTLLALSIFLGSFSIVGKTSRSANLLIVNIAAPVCTAITAGVALIVAKGGSTLGAIHTYSTVFLLAFGVFAGLAAVYRRFK